jgi:dynein heavy chain
MRDANVPKFLKDDLPLFYALIQDLFPNVEIPDADYEELEVTIKESFTKLGLQLVDKIILKTIQLFDTFDVRFGVMIVGPTGGGKTTIY